MAVSQRFYRTARALILAVLLAPAIQPSIGLAAEIWHICKRYEKRVNCIVDGDTIWYRGEKMRLLDVNAPALDGACRRERHLATQATRLLITLANSGIVSISWHGHDEYGRTLVRIHTNGGQVGPILSERGLADWFGDGIFPDWCQ